jgi:hypothetical protein
LYLGGEVSAISPFSDARYPDINNNGWVAYQAFNGTSTEIYLAQPFCAAQFTTADNSEYLVVGLIYPGEVHYLGFAASNFSQPVFTGKSQVTGQGQDQNGPWETYVYGYSFSGGPMYVGGGYSSANSGWYYGVNLQNQQVSFNGAYVKNPSGNYYDYFHAFSTGAVYLGASYAGTAAGYFYGLPATAPQTHYLGALVQAQSFNDYNLMCSPYWSLTHCLTVLDETY